MMHSETASDAGGVRAGIIEETVAALHRYYGVALRGRVYESPHLTALVTAWPDTHFNGICRAAFAAATVDAQIAAALHPFRAQGVPMLWHIGPSSAPPALATRLLAHGLTFYQDEPAMAVELGQAREAFPHPDGLTIEPVNDVAGLREWVEVWGAAMRQPMPAAARDLCWRAFCEMGLDPNRPYRHLIGRLYGEPVATAAVFLTPRVVSVEQVMTLPAARGRGIGTAMTVRVLREGRLEGCQLGVLSASPMGQPVYARIGFREVFVWRRYRWDPPGWRIRR